MSVRLGETEASNIPRTKRLSIAVWKFVHFTTETDRINKTDIMGKK
jgi:hypothetical protein